MAASIHLSDLAYATPDGHALFTGLGLTFGPARAGLVGRNGVGKTTLLKLISGELRPRSGHVSVTGRLAVLRQTLQVDPDGTVADLFGVGDALAVLHRAERGGATRYGGNWTAYRELKAQELAAAERTLADADKRVADVARTAQQTAERQARRNGTGKRQGLKGGTPRILLGLRKDRAEGTTAGNARLAEKLREQAAEAADAARAKVEVLQPLTVKLPPTGLPAGKAVLRVEGLTAGYEPGRPIVRDLTFAVTGPERVAVAGPNGSGTTTLLSALTGRLAPWGGTAGVLTAFALLDQQVSVLDPSASVRDNFRRLNPGADEQTCRSSLAKLLFRADAALQAVGTLSGGQRLRAGLACVLGVAPPPLLILDEPTNHLDVDAIEAVEAGLRAYDGALLVVSHDEAFLAAIGVTRRVEL